MIDVWKMISLLFPFVEIILHSILHVLRQHYRDQKIVKKMAIYGLPITYLIFLVGYMIYPIVYHVLY